MTTGLLVTTMLTPGTTMGLPVTTMGLPVTTMGLPVTTMLTRLPAKTMLALAGRPRTRMVGLGEDTHTVQAPAMTTRSQRASVEKD